MSGSMGDLSHLQWLPILSTPRRTLSDLDGRTSQGCGALNHTISLSVLEVAMQIKSSCLTRWWFFYGSLRSQVDLAIHFGLIMHLLRPDPAFVSTFTSTLTLTFDFSRFLLLVRYSPYPRAERRSHIPSLALMRVLVLISITKLSSRVPQLILAIDDDIDAQGVVDAKTFSSPNPSLLHRVWVGLTARWFSGATGFVMATAEARGFMPRAVYGP